MNQYFHYKGGGYPRENSPPRYADAADKLANMFIGAEYIGEGSVINKYLEKEFGLKLVHTTPLAPLKMKKMSSDIRAKFKAGNLEHLARHQVP